MYSLQLPLKEGLLGVSRSSTALRGHEAAARACSTVEQRVNMETSLTYDNKDRSLGLAFKERLRESDNEVELKVSGLLNTKTGRLDGFGSLRKFIFLGGQLPDRNPYLRPAAEKRRTR